MTGIHCSHLGSARLFHRIPGGPSQASQCAAVERPAVLRSEGPRRSSPGHLHADGASKPKRSIIVAMSAGRLHEARLFQSAI